MSTLILPYLYPMAAPLVAYYALKYATSFAVDAAINKTKGAVWYVVTYPFKSSEVDCIKCKCEKCRQEDCEKLECQQGYEIIDFTNIKEKID